MPRSAASYESQVFVNCPFDDEYRPIFRAVTFAIVDCGYIPRSALEIYNSGQVRIHKIMDLVAECRLGIHDLSRTELDPASGLPRFNMPLELGIFLGAQWLGSPKQKRKSCLVLDRERYRYQIYCSDIAGQDISAHKDNPKVAVRLVRDWLRSLEDDVMIPGGEKIWERYRNFHEDLPIYCEVYQLDPSQLTFPDLTSLIGEWLKENEW